MKRVILCADDYGQNLAVSQAILALIQLKRLTATSCLVTSSIWDEAAAPLKECLDKIDIGLHLNLTEGPLLTSLEATSLSKLIMNSQCRLLQKNKIEDEIKAQVEKFFKSFDRLPDYIDGHQHVHQFPQVRDALLNVYQKTFEGSSCYLRCTHTVFQEFNLKQIIISLLGGYGFKKLIKNNLIPHNKSFSGIYSFNTSQNYRKHFLSFISTITDSGLIMCHPGFANPNNIQDSIALSRVDEYNYLSSDFFLQDCATHLIELSRFSQFIV